MIEFQKWLDALTKPAKLFSSEKGKANLTEGAKHLVIAGIIAGIISGILAWVGITAFSMLGGLPGIAGGALVGVAAFIASIILTPIVIIIGWIIGSGILYLIALLLGGKGGYAVQSYFIALYTAPLAILTSILVIIPLAGAFLNLLVLLYSLYLLTVALKVAHNFTTIKAVLVWLIPIVIIIVLSIAFAGALFGAALLGAAAFI